MLTAPSSPTLGSKRPTLPTSSTDFLLPQSPTALSASHITSDEFDGFLNRRFRRPSLLAPKSAALSENRLHSPLVSSFTLPNSRRRRHVRSHSHTGSITGEESDRERMRMDSVSPSEYSESHTPAENSDEKQRSKSGSAPLTPPRTTTPMDTTHDTSFNHLKPRSIRRMSVPLKMPRLVRLLAESRPEEDEVKSEAAFQRLINSGCDLPIAPHTPRSVTDRGRYPEEAGQPEDVFQRDETPSDDEFTEEDVSFSYSSTAHSSQPIPIKPSTPARSINGDDMYISESPSGSTMDIDMISVSPSVSSWSAAVTPNQWRYTPPPTSSAVRSNKRKLDDRFDPYPSSSKRRAVSPSVSHLRDSRGTLTSSPMINGSRTPHPIRLSGPMALSIPSSSASSGASSPTMGSSYLPYSFPVGITSSPTLRASMGLASPSLRPLARNPMGMRRSGEGEEKEVDGAGEGVGGLHLG